MTWNVWVDGEWISSSDSWLWNDEWIVIAEKNRFGVISARFTRRKYSMQENENG